MPKPRLILGGSLLIAAMVVGCAAPTTRQADVNSQAADLEAARQLELAAKDLVEKQKRLRRVQRSLATKSTSLCLGHVAPDAGLFAMNRPKGDFGPAFERLYGINDRLTILFVLDGSPAQRAGLKPGDVIAKLNGDDTPDAKVLAELQGALLPAKEMRYGIERGGKESEVAVAPDPACWYPILVTPDQGVNAFADGTRIRVTRGMVNFASSDDELALVVSHEMAHNAMRHLEAKKKNAGAGLLADLAILILSRGQVSTSAFQALGANAYSQEFEAEADYVGLYIMANAGMPIDNAPLFWRRMAAEYPASIRTNHAASHPSTSYRMIALENAVQEIKGKLAAHQPLLPNMKDGEVSIATAPPAEPVPASTEPPASAQAGTPSEATAPASLATAAASIGAGAPPATVASTAAATPGAPTEAAAPAAVATAPASTTAGAPPASVASTAVAAPSPADQPSGATQMQTPAAAPASASAPPASAGTAQRVEPVALAAPSVARADKSVGGLPAAGTSWTYGMEDRIYRSRNGRFTITVSGVAPHTIREKVSMKPGQTLRPRSVRIQSAGFEDAELGGSEHLIEFAPYFLLGGGADTDSPRVEAKGYPMKTGEYPWVARLAEPVRWETITVPAGTFRALRLRLEGRRTPESYSPIVISRFSIDVWYAPDVNRYIRLEHKEWLPSRLATHQVIELRKFEPAS